MKVRKVLVLAATVILVLSLGLYVRAANSELRVKFGALSHWNSFIGSCDIVVGGDYLLHLEDSPFGVMGGLGYVSSVRTTFYADIVWRDIATTLSFLYFPTLARRAYLGMGLEYHWVTKEVIYLFADYHYVQKGSGLGLHFVVGFNLGEHIFLEGKINSVGIDYRNKGGISLQIGGRF